MAEYGRVHKACPNASNPYHVCAEFCLQKNADAGKTPKDRKGLGGSTIINEDKPHKMAGERKVHPACKNASNPYHECAEYCFKIADARTQGTNNISGSLGSRKKKGFESHSGSPQSNGGTKLHLLSKKKMEEHNGAYSSSSLSPTEEISSSHSFLDKKLHQSSQVMPMSGFVKPDHPEEQSRNTANSPPSGIQAKESASEDAPGKENSVCKSKVLTSSVGVQATNGNDEGPELVTSDSDSRAWVGKYHVKSSISTTLRSILEKHGDIAAGCQLESPALQAYYLECLCFVIQELKCTPLMYLTKSKVKEMLAILKDIEGARINVSWLRDVLNQITEALELISRQRVAEVAKAKYDQDIEKRKEDMKFQLEILAQKEKEVASAKAKLAETKARLNELKLRSSQEKEIMSTVPSKVEKNNCKSLLDEIP